MLHLDEWLDGSLPPLRRRECDAHAAGCPQCAAYVASYRTMVQMLRAGADEPADLPESLVQEIVRLSGA